jgi:hypothetical protein
LWTTGAETSGNWITRYVPSLATPNVSIPEFNRRRGDNYQVMAGTSEIDKPVSAWLGDTPCAG